MKITRGGKEYELSDQELLAAYHEQEQKFYRNAVERTIGTELESVGHGHISDIEMDWLKINQPFITAVTKELQRLKEEKDGDDDSFIDVVTKAFENVLPYHVSTADPAKKLAKECLKLNPGDSISSPVAGIRISVNRIKVEPSKVRSKRDIPFCIEIENDRYYAFEEDLEPKLVSLAFWSRNV